jgi:tetratricopeptide (TPR) repeat protein
MSARHLNLITLERFAASDLDPAEMIAAGRHLSTCASCRARLRGDVEGGAAVLRRLAHKGWPEEEPGDYEQVFERLQLATQERISQVENEREIAPRLAEELLALSTAEQRFRLNESRFHNAALADLLLERCSVVSLDDPACAEELAQLALAIADRLEAKERGQVLANDLRARAWASIGNIRRIFSDFRTAEAAIAKAEALLEEGSGDPIERARVLDLKASLLRAERRFDQALAAIDQTVSIYRRIHDDHRQGRALISKAMIQGNAGEQEKGVTLFFRALDLIDVDQEPRLALVAFNNLLVDLTELGRFAEASALLPEVYRHLAISGTRADRLTVCWAEAQLEIGIGHLDRAEAMLRLVRDEFVAQGLGYNAALASLDLAKIYLEQGRTAETRQLALEMHSIFAAQDIHREALVAVAFFQQAAEQERATVWLVEQVTGYLKLARINPGLPEPIFACVGLREPGPAAEPTSVDETERGRVALLPGRSTAERQQRRDHPTKRRAQR